METTPPEEPCRWATPPPRSPPAPPASESPRRALADSSAETPALPFLSHEAKAGDPSSLAWENFAKPKLRKYPKPSSTIQVESWIGGGVDGGVFRARTDDGSDVVVKIFFDLEQPRRTRKGEFRYWAFKRECCNCATLELISASLRRAAVSDDRTIFLHPEPRTRAQAVRNLRAFSEDRGDKYRAYPAFRPFKPDAVHINDCLGWLQLDGRVVRGLFDRFAPRSGRIGPPRERRAEKVPLLAFKPWFFAIVYAFVPEGTLQDDVLQSSFDLFYLSGFISVAWKEDNWRGAGVLVDHSDLVRPDEGIWWDSREYSRMVKKADGRYDLERDPWSKPRINDSHPTSDDGR